jgi:AraC-like DNA-binding protein
VSGTPSGAARLPLSKGYLNPDGNVRMTRLPPGDDVADVVRHYWIPQWDLPPGQTKRQVVLGYPACNLVVEPGVVALSGPSTRVTHRDLTGRSWAVGALLRPAGGAALLASGLAFGPLAGLASGLADGPLSVAAMVDREIPVQADDLRAAVTDGMARADVPGAVAALEEFLRGLRGSVTADGLLANRMQELVEGPAVRRIDELATELAVSARTLQRLARTFVGLTPSAMIRRRRLQDAADVVRRNPGADLATVAVEHGYADHAHLTREFRDVLGFTPSQYRAGPHPRPSGGRARRREAGPIRPLS